MPNSRLKIKTEGNEKKRKKSSSKPPTVMKESGETECDSEADTDVEEDKEIPDVTSPTPTPETSDDEVSIRPPAKRAR